MVQQSEGLSFLSCSGHIQRYEFVALRDHQSDRDHTGSRQ